MHASLRLHIIKSVYGESEIILLFIYYCNTLFIAAICLMEYCERVDVFYTDDLNMSYVQRKINFFLQNIKYTLKVIYIQ